MGTDRASFSKALSLSVIASHHFRRALADTKVTHKRSWNVNGLYLGPSNLAPAHNLFNRFAERLDTEIALSSSGQIRQHSRIMRRKRSEGESAPMTLGGALAAKVRLIAWSKTCQHRG